MHKEIHIYAYMYVSMYRERARDRVREREAERERDRETPTKRKRQRARERQRYQPLLCGLKSANKLANVYVPMHDHICVFKPPRSRSSSLESMNFAS